MYQTFPKPKHLIYGWESRGPCRLARGPLRKTWVILLILTRAGQLQGGAD